MTFGIRIMLAVLVLLAPAHLAAAQTADEILERSITALGGRAAHAKLKSRLATGSIVLGTPVGDITGSIEVLNAPPNKTRTLIKADLSSIGAGPLVVDQRFDGHSGYVLDSLQGNRDITGSQLETMKNSAFPHIYLGYKELGIAVKLGGKEKVGDREAYAIVFEPATGPSMRNWIDAETYMPIKMAMTVHVPQLGTDVEQTTEFLDYKEIDGVKVPFRLRASSSVQNFTVTVDKIEHNVPVDEKLFVKPAP